MLVTLSWHYFWPDFHEMWWAGGPVDQRGEKYPYFRYLDNSCHGNQKTSLELIKHLKGYGILSGRTLGGTKIVVMDFCYHGNPSVAIATKKWIETYKTLLTGSVATPLTRPSEGVKALDSSVPYYHIWAHSALVKSSVVNRETAGIILAERKFG